METFPALPRLARMLLALGGTLAVVALAVLWLRPAAPGFATPTACLEAFRDSCKDGDAAAFTRCLAGSLVGEGPALFDALRRDIQAVRHWNQYTPEVRDGVATILVDQVRTDGMIHRATYRLERLGSGWRLVAIGPPEILRPAIRPGTHVNDAQK
jgi:hypothetical protein